MREPAAARLGRLAWTLAGIGLAIAPHVRHLPLWILIFVLTIAAWRLAAERGGWPLPPRLLRLLVAATGFAGVLLTYRTINGLDAGTALLVIMMGMKLMETKRRRDETVLLLVAYFLVLASFLYSQSMWTLIYLFATVWVITTALLQISRTTPGGLGLEAFGMSGKLLLQATPVMIILFLLFPRVPGPFWALPSQGRGASSGLSEEMSPGSISDLSLSDAVAFRVRFSGTVPPPVQRYWRGPVLHNFDGFKWWRGSRGRLTEPDIVLTGEPVEYRLTLEPHNRRWLFGLDMPQSWSDTEAVLTWDYQLMRKKPVRRLTSLSVTSYPDFRTPAVLPDHVRLRDTEFPVQRNPRTQGFALELRERHVNDEDLIAAVLDIFREQEFYYTLRPPRLDLDSVDDFLFNTRSGFCGHFASSFTMLMRAAGVPARVVTGYQGGEYNPIGGYYIVRQSDAHAWSEVWLENSGWVRVDPTAAVAPERIEQGLEQALPFEDEASGSLFADFPVLERLRLGLDALTTLWNEWVLEFGPEHQRSLLSKLGIEDAHWRTLALVLVGTLALFLGLLSWWLARSFKKRRRDPAAEIYALFCARLGKRQLTRGPGEGPRDFCRRVVEARPELRAIVEQITELYIRVRYEGDGGAAELSRLRHLVNTRI